MTAERCFDSILVRLKVRSASVAVFILSSSFDSILVRLKAKSARLLAEKDRFRFHTGSIKSRIQENHVDCVVFFRFDSILVRLKV